MRRAVSSVTVALGLFGATVAPAVAAMAAPTSSAPVTPGKKRCTIEDPRLRELSGLVATRTGYIVINDGSPQENRKRVFYLDTRCAIAKEPVRYSGDGPFDTEDLTLSPDGKTLWIADTGDNVTSKERRSRVAVWTMPVDGSKQPVLHRLSYPERKPHDAEALLIGADGLPLVITKVPSGKSEIFTPTGKLRSGDTEAVPMKKVGEVSLPTTSTENPLSILGRVAITGAARSPDGAKVVLRTYADAFEYDVTGGDVLAALTGGKPRVTPLADPFGEAISYTPDGKTFVTVSDGGDLAADDPIDILAYTPSTKGAEPTGNVAAAVKKPAEKAWYADISLDQIKYLILTIGIIGVLLLGAGVFGIVRARRNPPPVDDGDAADRDDVYSSGSLPAGGGYGAGRPAGDPAGGDRPRGGVYGGAAGGGVYGGGRAGSGVYGAPAGAAPGRPTAGGGGGFYGGPRPPDGAGERPRGGGGVYGGGRPAGGGVYGGAPRGGPGDGPANGRGAAPQGGGGRAGVPGAGPGGGGPRGAAPAAGTPGGGGPRGGGSGGGPRGGGSGGGPRGGGSGGVPRGGGAVPRGGGAVPRGGGGQGGRAEPPRREPGPRDQWSGPRRDGRPDDRRDGQYGYGARY
ncbi:hypothetical protein ACFY3U_00040 [Micromonospora sp. NPDC000089]|uniref:hypothetical protein n=1 Tax=unclassified Micromonospora TaxID=2617518 RepID=UPI003687E825